jgi:hypothetical protein
LDESQRTAIALQQTWSRLRPEDGGADVDAWWDGLQRLPPASLTSHQRAVVDAYDAARRCREIAEQDLRPWIVRHNKGTHWPATAVPRRQRVEGAAVAGQEGPTGLPIPPQQLLPFFLAARSAVNPGQDLLGEALCSSYEAFRFTRQHRVPAKDDQDELAETPDDLSRAGWYLGEFDQALERCSGATHPKVDATVRRVVDLWETGEKVLVFAFYRRTCAALRVHISREIDRRLVLVGQQQLREAGRDDGRQEVARRLKHIRKSFFGRADSLPRQAVDSALGAIAQGHAASLNRAQVPLVQQKLLSDVMRRVLGVSTTLTRCFPVAEYDRIDPHEALERLLDRTDASGVSWRSRLEGFIRFLTEECPAGERQLLLEAARNTQRDRIRVEAGEEDGPTEGIGVSILGNVRVATGETGHADRASLMRAFNTPFFPEILVCSQVMGEGVDLQRSCRHVIHHDLDWNPSKIEQRIGRIDRLGCKAEGRHPIVVYLPYLAGAADERQYQVMTEREQWFRVVMGQDEVARLITPDSSSAIPLPGAIADGLSFKLGLDQTLA